MAGARRALGDPLTLIGSAPGCDIRLNVDGVAPIQGVILLAPDGPILRDLSSGGCRVNGQPVKSQRLVGGDLLELGPFQFRLELAAPPTAEVANAQAAATEQEREALRIQAAAVVAQQAALVEQEAKLAQRAAALEKQESQLAAHLESRQRELDEAQEELQHQRQEFAREQEEARAAVVKERAALEQARTDARADLEGAAELRQRLRSLRRRLFQRYRRQAADAAAAAGQREGEAEQARRRYDQERERLLTWYEKTNTEAELLRRALLEQRQSLALDQQRWEEALNAEKAERARRDREAAERSAEFLAAREQFTADQQRWQQQKAHLSKETAGLESRIAAQRQLLGQLERQSASQRQASPAAPLAATELAIPPSPAPEPNHRWPEQMQQVAGWLGDQRMHLLENWEKFLLAQQAWEEERSAALAEIEQAGKDIELRGRTVAEEERGLHVCQAELAQRQQALDAQRLGLEGLQTRLAMQDAACRAESERLNAGQLASERQVAHLRGQYEQVHRRRNLKREQELARLRDAIARADEARRQYGLAWQEQERLRQALEQRERALSAGESALELARRDLALQSNNPAAVEARLERLHLEALAREQEAARALETARVAVQQERQRLDFHAGALSRKERELAEQAELQRRESDAWEAARVAADAEQQRRDQESRNERARHAIDQRELRQLREELDRLAAAMMQEGEIERLAPSEARSQSAA
jgi:hypothetical protein